MSDIETFLKRQNENKTMTISPEYAEELGRQVDELEAENERLREFSTWVGGIRRSTLAECAKLVNEFDCHLAGYPNDEAKDYYESGVADACNMLEERINALATQPPSAPARLSAAAPVEPYAWVIPGDDQARDSGSIDAMAWREGEFTKPLYAQPSAAGMSRDDAESLVFDLLDAARSLDQTETAFRRGAREYYEEMRDKVISALRAQPALSHPQHSTQEK